MLVPLAHHLSHQEKEILVPRVKIFYREELSVSLLVVTLLKIRFAEYKIPFKVSSRDAQPLSRVIFCRPVLSLLKSDRGQTDIWRVVVRFEREGEFIGFFRFGIVFEFFKYATVRVLDLMVAGRESDCFGKVYESFLVAAEFHQRHAEIVSRIGIVRTMVYRLGPLVHGHFKISSVCRFDAEIVMFQRRIATSRDKKRRRNDYHQKAVK